LRGGSLRNSLACSPWPCRIAGQRFALNRKDCKQETAMPDWLVTSTFYGQWLPGDDRGSVTNVRERRPGDPAMRARLEHARPGNPSEEAMPGLRRAALEQLKCPPVCLDLAQAEELLEQFQETAKKRGWILQAVSIMFNHFHLVVEAPPAVGRKQILQSFKS